MKRKVSTKKYILAAIITSFIFIFGLLLGLVIEQERLSYTQKISAVQELNTKSVDTQYLYLNKFNEEKNCNAIEKIFISNLDVLDKSMKRVDGYKLKSSINKEEFINLQRNYLLEQIRYWLLAKNFKEICNKDFITVLSFTQTECSYCQSQTFILEYFKKLFDERLLLFHINLDLKDQEPLIDVLTKQYDVKELPSVIIGSKKFSGLSDKEALLKEICSNFKEKPSICYSKARKS